MINIWGSQRKFTLVLLAQVVSRYCKQASLPYAGGAMASLSVSVALLDNSNCLITTVWQRKHVDMRWHLLFNQSTCSDGPEVEWIFEPRVCPKTAAIDSILFWPASAFRLQICRASPSRRQTWNDHSKDMTTQRSKERIQYLEKSHFLKGFLNGFFNKKTSYLNQEPKI